MGMEGPGAYVPLESEVKKTEDKKEEQGGTVLPFNRDSKLSGTEIDEIQDNLEKMRVPLERVYKEEGPFDYEHGGTDETPIIDIGLEMERKRSLHEEMGHRMVRTDEEKDGTKISREDFYEGDSKIPIRTTVRTIYGENPDGIDRTYEDGKNKKIVFKTPEDSDRWEAKQNERRRVEEEERKRKLENGENLGRLPSRFEIGRKK